MIAELVSVAVGGVLGAAVTWLIAQRSLRAENVVQERTKWRERMRELGLAVAARKSAERLSWVSLALSVNPNEPDDVRMVRLSRKGKSLSKPELLELIGRLSLLLKHDWERAKIETSWWPFRATARAAKRVGRKLPNYSDI